MIAHYADDLPINDQVEALAGLGAIADDVAQAKYLLNLSALDIVQHRPQGSQIGMNVGNNGKHIASALEFNPASPGTSYQPTM